MTAVNSFPRLRPQVAFPDGPNVVPAATDWTELTGYVRDDSNVKIQRGRSNEFSKFTAGKLTGMVLDNRTRVFDPTWTGNSVPFLNNVQPSKQIQIMAEYPWLPGQLPTGRLRNSTLGSASPGGTFPGTAGVGAPAIDPTQGYINAGDGLRAVKFSVTDNTQNGGLPYIHLSPALGIIAGQWFLINLRVRCSRAGAKYQLFWRDLSAGAQLNLYQSAQFTATAANTWYQANTPTQAAAATSVWAVPGIMFPTATNGDQWWVDAIVVDYVQTYQNTSLFYGYVDDWHLDYPGRDATCTVAASDAFAMFGVKDIVSTGYEDAVKALPNLRHYWSLSQPATYNIPTVPEDAPGTARMNQEYFAAWGIPGPVLTDLFTGVGLTDDQTLAIGGYFNLGALITPQAGVGWTVGWWFQMNQFTDRMFMLGSNNDPASNVIDNTSNAELNALSVFTGSMPLNPKTFNIIGTYTPAGGAFTSFSVVVQPPSIKELGINGLWDGRWIAGNPWDGAWHLFCMARAADNKTYSFWLDGQQVTPTVLSGGGTLSGQNVIASGNQPFNFNKAAYLGGASDAPAFTGQLAHFFCMDSVITSAAVANLYNKAQNQWFGQTPGSRIGAVLDVLSFPSSMRNLDAGNSTLAAETTVLAQQNSFQYMQYVEDSENGWFFMDKSGNARLIARQNMIKPPGNVAQWTLGDLWPQAPATELPIFDAKIDNSNTMIYTEAEGSRKGGPMLYVNGSQLANQGKRTISLSNLLNATDDEVYNILNYRVSQYQMPKLRILSVIVRPDGVDELWNFVLSAEIGQVCQVNIRPVTPGGLTAEQSHPISALGRIQQLQHTIGRRSWETEVTLAQVDVQTYLTLDNATLGKLDSGNVLAY